jgi:hypothetical protein
MSKSQDYKSAAAMSDSESEEDTAVVSEPPSGHRAQNAYFKTLYTPVSCNIYRQKELMNERTDCRKLHQT